MDSYNARLGLVLFTVYLVLYAGFVLLSAFSATTMDWIVFAGVNLAVAYGFGLILAAFALSAVYGLLCGRREARR